MKIYRKSLKGGYNYKLQTRKRNNKKKLRSPDETYNRSKARGYKTRAYKTRARLFKKNLNTNTKTETKTK